MKGFVRFHFLTGIVLMLSASLALLLNFSPQSTGKISYFRFFPKISLSLPPVVYVGRQATFGFPFQMKEAEWSEMVSAIAKDEENYQPGYIRAVVDQSNVDEIMRSDRKTSDDGPEPKMVWLPESTVLSMGIWNWPHAAWNGGIALVFLITVTLLTEVILRRRDRHAAAKAAATESR